MTLVADWTFEFGDTGYVFGANTACRVKDFTSDVDISTHDADIPRHDGGFFGRDTRGGAVHTLDMAVRADTPAAALDAYDTFKALWRGDSVRFTPGAVTTLKLRRPGRGALRVYGRPRKCTPSGFDNVASGYIPFVADFKAADDVFYADTETQLSLGIPAAVIGGFTAPATAPWSAADVSAPTSSRLVVGGSVGTWVCFDIYGPVSNPTVGIDGLWTHTLLATIPAGQSVTIDPRPWARSVKTNLGGGVAGNLTSDSPALSRTRLTPGTYQLRFGGTDLTGSSYVVARWRDATASW